MRYALGLLTLLMSQTALSQTTTAVSSGSAYWFPDSIGVNTKFDSALANWQSWDVGLKYNEMQYLGIHRMRDGAPHANTLPIFQQLAAAGIIFDVGQGQTPYGWFNTVNSAGDVARVHAFLTAPGVPWNAVETLEGANEYNYSFYSLGSPGCSVVTDITCSYSVDNTNQPKWAWGTADDIDLQNAIWADSFVSSRVKHLAASTSGNESWGDHLPNVGSWVDASNWHVYAPVASQIGPHLEASLGVANATAPGKPIYITEMGVSTIGISNQYVPFMAADEYLQAMIIPNALLTAFKDGVVRTFVYMLEDDTLDPGTMCANFNGPQPYEYCVQQIISGNMMGLFRHDHSGKPSAWVIHNINTVLSAKTYGSASSAPLNYWMSGLPSTASIMWLQKDAGVWDAVIWDSNVPLSNTTWGANAYRNTTYALPPRVPVTLSATQNFPHVSVYDMSLGQYPVQTLSNTGTVSFGFATDIMIVEFNPNW